MSRRVPISALRGTRQFVLAGEPLDKLTAGLGHKRNFGTYRDFLRTIGQWCWENNTEGVFTLAQVRQMPLTVQRRTAIGKHLPDLVACGAVVATSPQAYAIVGYTNANLSEAAQRHAADITRADWRRRKQRQRALSAQCVQAQQEKSPTISAAAGGCHAQQTKATPPERMRSGTNDRPTLTKAVSDVGPPSEGQSQPSSMTALGRTVGMFLERAQRACAARAAADVSVLTADDLAAADQLATQGGADEAGGLIAEKTLANQGSEPSPAERKPGRFPVRVARKPETKTPINQHVVESAMRKVAGGFPSTACVSGFFADMVAIGVCAEDLNYGVFETNRQQKKQRVRDPLAYMRRVILAQAQAVTGMVT